MKPRFRDRPRDVRRRAVLVLPSGLTLGNLFFGVFAIVSASRGQFSQAALYVVLGGVCDVLDGRVARATRTGSRFGEELDSLVDAISFGLAPALIMYFAVLNRDGWDWIWAFLFAMCAVVRLARFNVEQAGTSKTHFHGLPSPAAGMTLATYYWFSQTPWYTETMIGDLQWQVMMRFVMASLAFLMISDVPYPVVPTISFRSIRGIAGGLTLLGIMLLLIFRREFFFPVLLTYVAYGPLKNVLVGVQDRLPSRDVWAEQEDEDGNIVDDSRQSRGAPDRSPDRSPDRPSRAEPEELAEGVEPGASSDRAAGAPAGSGRRRRRRRRGPPGPETS